MGQPPAGHLEVVSSQPWSAVWRIPTAAGPVLLKQTTSVRRGEGAKLALVADLAGRFVDRPLAYDSGSGRILLRDLGSTMLTASPGNRGIEIGSMTEMVADYARLQHATIGTTADALAAGLESWDPGRAFDDAARQARLLHALPPSDARHITAIQRDRILAARSSIEAAAHVVAASPIPFCLEHGDLWPGNVIRPQGLDGGHRFIDFGDAAWSHPFLSLIMLIIECRFRWSVDDQPDRLDISHPAIATITDAYLSHWTDYAPMPALRRTLQAALQLAPLRRSRAWINNLTRAELADRLRYGHMPWTWLDDATRPVTA